MAESAALDGIVKMTKIDHFALQVSLNDRENAQKVSFSHTWTPLRTVLPLAAGPLALVNVIFLVADADLAVENSLIRLPVSQHLGVDTKTLLEDRCDLLDGTERSSINVANTSKNGDKVNGLMIARLI